MHDSASFAGVSIPLINTVMPNKQAPFYFLYEYKSNVDNLQYVTFHSSFKHSTENQEFVYDDQAKSFSTMKSKSAYIFSCLQVNKVLKITLTT